MTSLRPRDIGVEIFQSERKLAVIDAFRTSSELRSLQLSNNQPEALDLGLCLGKFRSIRRDLRGQVMHQPMQRIDIRRQRGEIEIHTQSLIPAGNDTHGDCHRESISRRGAAL